MFLSAGLTHPVVRGVTYLESVCSLLSDSPERSQVAVQQVPTGAFLPVSIIHIATGSLTLVLGAVGELVKVQPCTNTQPTAERCFLSQRSQNSFQCFQRIHFLLLSCVCRRNGLQSCPTSLWWLFTFLSPNLSNVLIASEPGERTQMKDGTAVALDKRCTRV